MNALRVMLSGWLVLASSACMLAGELMPAAKLTAGGKPVDVMRVGHSAPFVGDFDGDGIDDLLVGEFHLGRLRIFRNRGTNRQPAFEDFQWFKAGGSQGRVPTG